MYVVYESSRPFGIGKSKVKDSNWITGACFWSKVLEKGPYRKVWRSLLKRTGTIVKSELKLDSGSEKLGETAAGDF